MEIVDLTKKKKKKKDDDNNNNTITIYDILIY